MMFCAYVFFFIVDTFIDRKISMKVTLNTRTLVMHLIVLISFVLVTWLAPFK